MVIAMRWVWRYIQEPARCGRTRMVRTAAMKSTSSEPVATTAGRLSATDGDTRAHGRRTRAPGMMASNRPSRTGCRQLLCPAWRSTRGTVSPSGRATYSSGRSAQARFPEPVTSSASCFNEKMEELRRETLLTELRQRIRDVRQGPDGLLYLVTDEKEGAVLRIEPVN